MNLRFINIFSLLQQPEWKHSFRKERVTRGLSTELKLTQSTRKAQNWRWTKCNSFGQIQIDKSSQKPNKKSKHTKCFALLWVLFRSLWEAWLELFVFPATGSHCQLSSLGVSVICCSWGIRFFTEISLVNC